MQLFKKGQAAPTDSTSASTAQAGTTKLWLSNNKRSIAAVALIVLAALFMRTIFAYAISANSGFALSGGTTATEHLRNIVAMITSGSFFGPDGWLFHPFGSDNIHPPLIDMILAGIAGIVMSVTHMSAEQAASATLGASSAIVGALACIPMYYLGKEIFDGKKRAGFLAALFLAFCPIVVTNTVFSNGTTIAFALFFVICMLYFMVKGIKALDNDHTLTLDFKGMLSLNKDAMKYAVISGIIFAVIAYSWNGFRSLAIFIIFMMIVMMLIGRLTGKDVRVAVTFFTIILGIGVIAAAPFYVAAGLWDLVFSGIAYATIIALVFCISFAFLQGKPWVYTIPGYIVAAIVLFVALYFAVPDVFNVIVNGNSVYAKDIQGLISNRGLTISAIATYFGYFTMWCGTICVIYMVFKFGKNMRSNFFIASFFALIFGMLFAIKSTALAVIYAPFFALGFAAFINWMFETISFSEYFKSFKGCDIKTIWRKIINPKPFIAIVCVLLLIAAPNMLTAVDASISNNDKSDWNKGASDIFNKSMFGSVGYTVYTDEEYKINYTLKQLANDSDNEGKTMLTWFEYSADVVTYGHFKSVTDTRGNNAIAMAQILLGDETRGEATAAMIIYSMYVLGYENAIPKVVSYLSSKGISTEGLSDRLNDVFSNPAAYKEYILKDSTTYGQLSTGISDQNAVYIFLKKYLTQGTGAGEDIGNVQSKDSNFPGISTWELSHLYNSISAEANTHIDKIMVTIGMLPIQYGDGSVFSEIAAIAGYKIDGTYGNAPQFYTVNSSSGAYSYTTAMYNTLLYKTIGGKTSSESSESMDASKFEAIYGISNFSADYTHFYVKYNSNKDASATDSGWQLKTYDEANGLKAKNGGVINYFGYPVIINTVSFGTSDENTNYIKGTVTDSTPKVSTTDNPIKNARVEAWSKTDGKKLAMAYTDKNGYYEIPIKEDAILRIYVGAASTETTGGTLVYSTEVSASSSTTVNFKVDVTSFSGFVDFQDEDVASKTITEQYLPKNVIVTLTGTNYKKTYTYNTTADDRSGSTIRFSFSNLVVDTYSIKITTADGTSLGSGTYLVTMGTNEGYRIAGTICDTTITVTGTNSLPIVGKYVKLTATGDDALVYKLGVTNYNGKTTDADGKVYIVPGKYTVGIYASKTAEGEYTDLLHTSTVTITSASSTNTVSMAEMLKITINYTTNIGDLMVTNGIENYTAEWNGTNYTVYLPKSPYLTGATADNAAKYLVYQYHKGVDAEGNPQDMIVYGTVVPDGEKSMTVKDVKASVVTGKLTSKTGDSDAKASSGTVYFYIDNVSVAATATKVEGTDDYKYTIYLPETETGWGVYATNGTSMVKYDTTSPLTGQSVTLDIQMGEGYKISGKYYWGSSNYFSNARLIVSGILQDKTFDILTDANGSYSLIVPKDSSCTIKTPSLEGTPYYFDSTYDKEQKKDVKTWFIEHKYTSDSKTYSFIAYTDKVKASDEEKVPEAERHNYIVYNNTGKEIYIDGTKVAAGDKKTYDYSLSHPYITVKLNYLENGGHYVYCESIKVFIDVKDSSTFGCAKYYITMNDILDAYTDVNNQYSEVKVKYTDTKPTVTITNVRSSDVVDGEKPFSNLSVKSGTDQDDTKLGKYVQKFVKYYNGTTEESKDGFLTNPYLVKITSKVDSQELIYYTTMKGDVSLSDINADTVLKPAVTYSGSVGTSYSGTVNLSEMNGGSETGVKFTATVSSGSYSIVLPNTYTYKAIAKVSTTSDGFKYNYWSAEETLTVNAPITTETPNPKITHNFAVEIHGQKEPANDNSVAMSLSLTGMSLIKDTNNKYKVEFTATVTGAAEGTYKLSGGSDWNSIRFFVLVNGSYVEATSVTIDAGGSTTIKCEGTITTNYIYDKENEKITDTATATWGSPNLSVVLTTLAGKTYVKQYFGNNPDGGVLPIPGDWKKTNLPVKVGFGSNTYATEKRVFSIKFVNPNNFPVTFVLDNFVCDEFDVYKFTVVSGMDIKILDKATKTISVTVAGSTTSEITIEVIGDKGTEKVNIDELKVRLTSQDSSITLKNLDEKDKEKIAITGSVISYTGNIVIENSVDVKDHSSSGRGVFNNLGSAPAYLMFLAGLTLLALIALIWLGYRRGVFARKK